MHANTVFASRKLIGIGAVMVLLQAGFLVVLNNGLNMRFLPEILKDFIVVPVEQTVQPPKPEPIEIKPNLDPTAQHLQLDVPLPQTGPLQPNQIVVPPPDKIDIAVDKEPVIIAPIASTSVMQDPRHPLSLPDYPAPSRRLDEQGTTLLRVHVLANGRVDQAVMLSSSGFSRLDEAAIREALRHWKLIPATRAGQAIDGWTEVPVTFQLN